MLTVNTLTDYNVRHTTFFYCVCLLGDLLVEVNFPLCLIEHQIVRVNDMMELQLRLFLPNVSVA